MDLRATVAETLRNYGHKVLLQRTSRKLRCRCWNEAMSSADPRCPFCSGSGWVSRIESHYTRKDSGSMRVSWPERVQGTGMGEVQRGTGIFYFMHNVYPQVGDTVLEVGWDSQGRPTHIVKAYRITYVFAHRGKGGRIEYFQAGVNQKVLDLDSLEMNVRKMGRIENYEIVGGAKLSDS